MKSPIESSDSYILIYLIRVCCLYILCILLFIRVCHFVLHANFSLIKLLLTVRKKHLGNCLFSYLTYIALYIGDLLYMFQLFFPDHILSYLSAYVESCTIFHYT